ncbi:MAG: hypothetical protein ACPG31_10640 [Planctomycetota bacterium]
MRLPLPTGWGPRCSILITGLLLISAYVPLPLPIGLINKAIALRAPELELAAEGAWIRWGRGEVALADLRLKHEDVDRARVDRLEAFLDLRPWSKAVGKPIRLQIEQADGDMHLGVIESLSKLRSNDAEAFPMQLSITDSALRWTDEEEHLYQIADVQADGYLSPGGSRLALHANALLPLAGDFALYADAGEDLNNWSVALGTEASVVEDWALLDHEDLPWSDAQMRLYTVAKGTGAELEDFVISGAVSCNDLRYTPLELAVSDFTLEFEGDLDQGFRLRADGRETHGTFRGLGGVTLDEDWMPQVHFRAEGVGLQADAEVVQWLQDNLPNIGEIVAGLEPRGGAHVGFTADWEQAMGLEWALHVDAAGAGVTFRGLEDEEGNRVSVPYPATVRSGDMITDGNLLLYAGMADVGTAGRAWSTGGFDFRPEDDVEFALDVIAEDIPLDNRITHALSGNPEIARLWRELGSPQSGTAGLEVQVRYVDQELGLAIRGDARNVDATPSLLPLPIHGDNVWFEWIPGHARFGGLLRAVGGDLTLSGDVQEAAEEGVDPILRMTLHGRGAAPSTQELNTLASYLRLPKEIASFPVVGDMRYDLQMILPLGEGQPHFLSGFTFNEAMMSWADMGLVFTPLHGQGGVAVHGEDYLISLPRTWSEVNGGNLRASLAVSSFPEMSRVTAVGRALDIDSDLLLRLQDFTGQEPWGQHIAWGGKADLRATLDPTSPEDFRARVDLKPLTLGVSEGEEQSVFTLKGAVHLYPAGFTADVLRFSGPDVNLGVREVVGAFDQDVLSLQALLDSRSAVSMTSRLPLLADAETLAAIEAIGLDGKIRADALRVDALIPDGGLPTFTAKGGLILEDVTVQGVSPVSDGHASVQVQRAWWTSAQDFGARLEMQDGTGRLGEVKLEDASARVAISPESIQLTDLEVSLLGGRLLSQGVDQEGEPVQGFLSLGLDSKAPISLRLFAEDLDLERMRRELDLRGSLAGKVDGYLQLSSPTPDPTFARGEGRFTIENGVLGTVPVLRSIWAFAGVRPPVFDAGELAFRMNGRGRVVVDTLTLDHDLLEVKGEGSIDLDTNLNMKVTLRTFSLLGRLPLLRDIIDLLIEQQVYGPAEAPIIRQRAVGKLGGGEFKRPPFPLWVPTPPRPDWRVSPIVPVE